MFFFILSHETSAVLQYLRMSVRIGFSGHFNKLCIYLHMWNGFCCIFNTYIYVCKVFIFSFGKYGCGRDHWVFTVTPWSLCLTLLILKWHETASSAIILQQPRGFQMSNSGKFSCHLSILPFEGIVFTLGYFCCNLVVWFFLFPLGSIFLRKRLNLSVSSQWHVPAE